MQDIKNYTDDIAKQSYDASLKQFDILHRSLDSRIATRTQLYAIFFTVIAIGLIGNTASYVKSEISTALFEISAQYYLIIAIFISYCILPIQTEIINLTFSLRDISKILKSPSDKHFSNYNILHSSFLALPYDSEMVNFYHFTIKLFIFPILLFLSFFVAQILFPALSNVSNAIYAIAFVNLINSIIIFRCIYRRKESKSTSHQDENIQVMKEAITSLDIKIDVLEKRLFHQEAEIQNLKKS